MKLRELSLKENETLISSEGQQPHNFTAKSQVGQGIEWPKATSVAQQTNVKRDEVEVPGDHHSVGHGEDSDGVSESVVREFAPTDSGDNSEEDALHKYARMWYNGDLHTQQQVEQILAQSGWEIGELESEEGGAFVVQSGDDNGDSYIGFSAEDLTESHVMEDEGGASAGATTSSDIAVVAYPMTRGRSRRAKRRAARAAVGQKYVPGPAYIGQGVFETSLATMRDYFAGNTDAKDPTKLAQMRDFFSRLSNASVPDEIQRIIWKLKNEEALFPEEYVKYKNWMEIRRKKVAKEAHVLDHQNVIYRLDRDKPMTDTEVLVLGGAGRYTLGGLRDKARREADALAADLKIEHGGSFRRAAENIKQLTNTLNTIVAAYNELKRIRSRGGRGSRGITDEEANFIRECTEHMSMLSMYTRRVNQARRIAEGIQRYLKEDKMSPEQASIIKGMFHLKTDPGYGFYRYAIHVAGNHGGDKVVLGPNAGPFAYAYTDAEEQMIRDAVKAITGKEPLELTGGKSEEPDFVNKNSTVPSIDWKKVK